MIGRTNSTFGGSPTGQSVITGTINSAASTNTIELTGIPFAPTSFALLYKYINLEDILMVSGIKGAGKISGIDVGSVSFRPDTIRYLYGMAIASATYNAVTKVFTIVANPYDSTFNAQEGHIYKYILIG